MLCDPMIKQGMLTMECLSSREFATPLKLHGAHTFHIHYPKIFLVWAFRPQPNANLLTLPNASSDWSIIYLISILTSLSYRWLFQYIIWSKFVLRILTPTSDFHRKFDLILYYLTEIAYLCDK